MKEAMTFDESEEVILGRSSSCAVRLPSKVREVSRTHTRIWYEDGNWRVEDISMTGTSLNDRRLNARERQALHTGDRLKLGPLEFTVEIETLHENGETDTFQAITTIRIARLNTDRVLKSALELPAKLGSATDEASVYKLACEYLVTTLSPAIESAHVLMAPREKGRVAEVLGEFFSETQERDGGPPLVSRRVVDRLTDDPEQIIFIHRENPNMDMDATVSRNTMALGASFIERAPGGEPILLYITGSKTVASGDDILAEYLRLVAVLTKQHLVTLRQAALSKFFSPKVIEMLMRRGGEAELRGAPWLTEATSLFFDLRGFSLSTEAHASDLLDLHADLRTVIDAVTTEVFELDGTVIDYQGDGIFAAWGVPFEQEDQALLAVKCALRIFSRLETMDLPVFANSRRAGTPVCGIGIAKGEVVAGGVGAGRMFKFGILGPSVNLAARLESLTKPAQMDAPILVTEEIETAVQDETPTRRVGRVRPAGIETPLNVYEIVIESASGEQEWGEDHSELWDRLLPRLEDARDPESVSEVSDRLRFLPEDHPRTRWAKTRIQNLETPDALAVWNGIIEQTKK